MEFNIALNTIVYLMIFIFPGILFRKFLFIREYSMEFDRGNLFERFIWTLFTSIAMLAFSAGIFYLLIKILNFELLSYISYETIRKTFAQISENTLPDPNTERNIDKIYFDFAFLMFSIYILSAALGFITYSITKSAFIGSTGIRKYLNYYNDLIKGVGHSSDDDSLTYGYTIADVLVETNESSKLYSGRVKNYFLQSGSSQLQTIVLCDAVRYKKVNGEVSIKEIPGHNFVIDKDRILNINFTYVYESKKENKAFRRLNFIINLIFASLIIAVISLMFISSVYVYTSTSLRKGVFIICGTLVLLVLNKNVKILLRGENSKLKLEDLFFIAVFGLAFLWIFNFFSWWVVLIMQLTVWIISSLILEKKSKATSI